MLVITVCQRVRRGGFVRPVCSTETRKGCSDEDEEEQGEGCVNSLCVSPADAPSVGPGGRSVTLPRRYEP